MTDAIAGRPALDQADEFVALHTLHVAGLLAPAPTKLDVLVERGLVIVSEVGILLTEAGNERHELLLELERRTLDLARIFEDLLVFERLDPAVKARVASLQLLEAGDDAGRAGQIALLRELAEELTPALERTAGQLPRFAAYGPRMLAALDRFADGDRCALADPRVESFHTVWMETHEDYVVTLGDDGPQEAE